MKILVPATSANIGPGFDSMGVALGLYLTLEILEPSQEWFIDHDLGEDIPHDQSNMIIETALSLKGNIEPHHLKMTSDIPTARGLGSSSSAIVAGILLAEALSGEAYSLDERIQIATDIEGHPDNVAPTIAGGLVIAACLDDRTYWIKNEFPEVDFIVDIPDYYLKTSDSRNVLPKELDFAEAVKASSVANIVAASLTKGDLKMAGEAMAYDRFHEPYRAELVKNLALIRNLLKDKEGVYGTYLSGAGPTVASLVDRSVSQEIKALLEEELAEDQILLLPFQSEGAKIIK